MRWDNVMRWNGVALQCIIKTLASQKNDFKVQILPNQIHFSTNNLPFGGIY